jgi:hypothetical protein
MSFQRVKSTNNSLKSKKNQSNFYSEDFSDEEMARDWTLEEKDIAEISKYRSAFRVFIAAQILIVRRIGRLVDDVGIISPKIVNYLNLQLALPPSPSISIPERRATYYKHRKEVLEYLGFKKFTKKNQEKFESWLYKQSSQGDLPSELLPKAEMYLLSKRIILPGQSVLERMIAYI